MENSNEVMNNNEEVIELVPAEEIAEMDSDDLFAKVAIGGLAVIVGVVAYKFAIKPAAQKVKEWYKNRKEAKSAKKEDVRDDNVVDLDLEIVDEEMEE